MSTKHCLHACAITVDELSELHYPLIASPKYDGVRALLVDGDFLSRDFKIHQNKKLAEWAKEIQAVIGDMWDGEIISTRKTDEREFTDTLHMVKTHGEDIDGLKFVIFDQNGVRKCPDCYNTCVTAFRCESREVIIDAMQSASYRMDTESSCA